MKKKLLFVTTHLQYSNGVASVLVELVNALDKNKYDITIMPMYICDQEYIQKIDKAVKIKPIFNGYFRGLAKLVRLIPQKLLYKMCVKEKYDVEIAFQFGTPTEMLSKSTNQDARHLAWIHGYGDMYLQVHTNYDKIICCSKSNAEKYRKVFAEPEKVTYLYNLVNDKVVLEKSKENLIIDKKYDFTFCAVGRLSPEKGFLRLIDCHKKLMQEGLCHNLWIVGGGAEYDKLNDFINSNNLQESAILFGAQKNPFNYMLNADMLVCSSLSEGFSTVCVEAALLGKSIITTEVAGAKEFVYDNQIGLMVENNDDSLYQGIKKILLDTDKIKEFENNISEVKDLHYVDRLEIVEKFFEEV